jgi:hypothetical protein
VFEQLAQQYSSFTRALHIVYRGKNLWGIGHILPAAYQAHRLCFSLRRNCYITMYNSRIEEYFTLYSRASWRFSDAPLPSHTYTSVAAAAAQAHSRRKLIVESLDDVRNVSNHKLVTVVITGPISFKSAKFLPGLPWDAGGKTRYFPACFFRYVMWPNVNGLRLGRALKNGTLHLRSGYADGPAANRRVRTDWFAKLCDWRRLSTTFNIVSDSPRIARMGGGTISSVPAVSTQFQMSDELFRDLVVIMLSRRVVTTRPSSFARPLAISSCVRSVENVDSVCPQLNQVLERDLIVKASNAGNGRRTLTYAPVSGHPCYGLRGVECSQLLMNALS